jgi:HSP20 family protein
MTHKQCILKASRTTPVLRHLIHCCFFDQRKSMNGGAVMSLTRYEPWNLVNRLHSDLDRLFGRQFANGDDESTGAVSDWLPAVDVQETKDAFVLTADLPGVDPKDIDITMESGVLTLRGRRENEVRKEENGYRRIERSSGEFFRRFALPDTADADAISAKSAHGVVTVTIGKKAEVQPRRIQVKTS